MTTFAPALQRSSLTIRPARSADADALARLARLDSRRTPTGDVLVAEVAGELWAAVSMDDAHAVADPFRPSGALVALLTARVRQLRPAAQRRRLWRGGLRPAFG